MDAEMKVLRQIMKAQTRLIDKPKSDISVNVLLANERLLVAIYGVIIQ